MSDQRPSNAPLTPPSAKSSREAELEELRRHQLAQNNAQKLAETAATTPINMSDWQQQQKALKDKERMRKTETAEFLHNYRGNTEEAKSKLSAIKQEDRRSKMDAANYLHNYRGAADGISPRKTPPKAAAGVAPGGHANVDQRSGAESVSSLAAGFTHTQEAAPETMFFAPWNGVAAPPSSVSEDPFSNFDASRPIVSEGPPSEGTAESMVMVDTPFKPPAENTSKEESPVLVEEEAEEAFDGVGVGKMTATEDEWVSVDSSNVPSPDEVGDLALSSKTERSFDSGDDTISRAVTEVAGNMDDEDIDDPAPLTEAQLHANRSGGEPVSLRVDIDFSFGLVTTEDPPDANKYMRRVATIVQSLYAENRPAGTGGAGHAIYNTAFPPFVRSVEEDFDFIPSFGREDTKRFMVSCSLPMFILDWDDSSDTREDVRNVLRAAVQDGRFLSLP